VRVDDARCRTGTPVSEEIAAALDEIGLVSKHQDGLRAEEIRKALKRNESRASISPPRDVGADCK
jgi:hypothetical protein